MKKISAINAINELPKEFDLEDLIEKLIVIEKIEEGLKEVKEGKVVSQEKVRKEVKKWFK